jgi:type I restriction enzyme R subunit
LEGSFDQEDLEGALTDVAQELKELPALHDAVWDVFRGVTNKNDEEAFELALGDDSGREEFYGRLSRFFRVLKLALANIQWVRTPRRTATARALQDGRGTFFQKLRASVKLRYAEEIDYRDYEKPDPEAAEHVRASVGRSHPGGGAGEHLRA